VKKLKIYFKRIIVISNVFILLFNLVSLSPSTLTLIQPAEALRYSMDTNISAVDASFVGEGSDNLFGWPISICGDVNGDGFDDILVGAQNNSDGGYHAGKIYLIFGKSSGWAKDINISSADASFIGENSSDNLGWDGCGVGDINGDGIDIFGKPSGWGNNISISNSDASFLGEEPSNLLGWDVTGAGDVNGDGFDDLLVSTVVMENIDGGSHAGKVYLIFGKATGWSMNNRITKANASFMGEDWENHLGWSMAGAGDVNGDGFDDIIMSAPLNDDEFIEAGQIYLIFGKASGWEIDTDIGDADASFIGENPYENTGIFIDGGGDFNADGFDDFIIGSAANSDGGTIAGKTYLIFGKANGWLMDKSLSKADASFLGENEEDISGRFVECAGDVNGDGFDDILISAIWNDKNGCNAGQVYLILGKGSGWSNDTNLSLADASFFGENSENYLGWPCAGGGDINGDGYDDIILGSIDNTQQGFDAGKIYLIFPELNYIPKDVISVKVYSDDNYKTGIEIADLGGKVYIELNGQDGNQSRNDTAFVYVTGSISSPDGIRLSLYETDQSSGTYRGWFKISNRTNDALKSINAILDENITITSAQDPTKTAKIMVSTPVQLRPIVDNLIAVEDEEYSERYWAYGYNPVKSWQFKTNASWLTWDPFKHTISGSPDNSHVGTFWARINITDGFDNYDEHNFTITVENTIPRIFTENIELALEDELYLVDYESDDEHLGTSHWILDTNANWLLMNSSTGELSGIPENDDVGAFWVNVSIDDGNGGGNTTNFSMNVLDVNDAPIIITNDVNSTFEDSFYSVDYDAIDIDDASVFEWYLNTNGSWLTINKTTGLLTGTPVNADVGNCYVNITAQDIRLNQTSRNFTLEVLNVNDAPEWITIPPDSTVKEGDLFSFDVKAIDEDIGDIITYDVSSWPSSNITMNPDTGLIEWYAGIGNLDDEPVIYNITITANDTIVTIRTSFELIVIPNYRPTTNLLSPPDNSIVSANNLELSWRGTDEENGSITYNLYVSPDLQPVLNLIESARALHYNASGSHIINGLELGATYYWTVIPHDGNSYGECLDGIFRFTINTPPLAPDIPVQKATVGKEFSYKIKGTDKDSGTISNLIYTLELYPTGMTIDPTTGVITWTPTSDQIGNATVSVVISDGIDSSSTTFEIKVSEQEEENIFGFAISLFSILIPIILFLIILFIIIKRKSKKKSSEISDQRISPPGNNLTNEKSLYLGPSDDDLTSGDLKDQTSPILDKTTISATTISQKPSISPVLVPSQEKFVSIDSQLPEFQPELVGRDKELNELSTILSRVGRGHGGTVLLSGETGIGKTRVVEELKRLAQAQGYQVLSGNCLHESQTPFYPFLEALRSGGLTNLFMEEPPKIEAVFLMTYSGETIKEVIREETELNLSVFSSILSTVGSFLKESFSMLVGAEKEGAFNTLGYENYRIIIESGKRINLAIILTGKENEFLIEDIKILYQKVIDNYGGTLQQWENNKEEADVKDIEGIDDILNSLIVSGQYDGRLTHLDDPRIRRNLLFKNVSLGLARQAETAPILLCIEDLQWSDPSSLALMHYIARMAKDNEILIVGTFRTEEVTAKDGKTHPFLETMQLMDIEGLYESLELNRLPEGLTINFLEALLGNIDFSAEFIHRFYQETDGNPLFMIELLKYLMEEQIIVKENGTWKIVKNLEEVKIPKKIYSVILSRLERLDNENRQVLDYASVIGEVFTSHILSKSLRVDRVKLLGQLRILEQTHKLIYPQDGNYRFDHSKIKEVLYNELPEEIREKYHSIIAHSIEELNKDNLEDVTEDLAFHYFKCKNKEKALFYLIKAAERAKIDYSLDEAIMFYSRALELEKDKENRSKILLGLKTVYGLKGSLKNDDNT
jgi:hypothetical protein